MTSPLTLFEKLWSQHTIEKLDDEYYLLHVDRCFLHDLSGPYALKMLKQNNFKPFNPNLVYGMPDHTLSSKPGRTIYDSFVSKSFMPLFRDYCNDNNIFLLDLGHPLQGIVHVVGPETGLTLPGMTIVCGDSHTCTHGALGALAWGIGTTELYHVLATQTLRVKKPKTMRVNMEGTPPEHIDPMDIILHIIATYGSDFGIGYAVEYAGNAIEELSIEGRMTICNLTVEFGSEYGFISPDQKTIDYMRERVLAPKGEELDLLTATISSLSSDTGAIFDREIFVDVSSIKPQISWGITPAHTIDIDGVIPQFNGNKNSKMKAEQKKALSYMGFEIGQSLIGVPVDRVFIGSCSNGRISNLIRAVEVVKGQTVAEGVEAWVVPGSQSVKREAEVMGLHKIFMDAGFLWGEPGCSLCGGCNGERVAPGKRCISTTNRNFIGRQGPNARTHLASPCTAALSAIRGVISNPICLIQ